MLHAELGLCCKVDGGLNKTTWEKEECAVVPMCPSNHPAVALPCAVHVLQAELDLCLSGLGPIFSAPLEPNNSASLLGRASSSGVAAEGAVLGAAEQLEQR